MTAVEQRESRLAAELGGHSQENEMIRTNVNPQVEATGPQSDASAIPKLQPAESGEILLALFEGNGLFEGLRTLIGHHPEKQERVAPARARHWVQGLAERLGVQRSAAAWFCDGTNPVRTAGFERVLKEAGWDVWNVNRRQAAHNPSCFHVRETIDWWATGYWAGPLLGAITCQLAWDRLKAARAARPDSWIGVAGYAELLPEIPNNDLQIEFFDLETDVDAHPTPLKRMGVSPIDFSPSQLLTMRD